VQDSNRDANHAVTMTLRKSHLLILAILLTVPIGWVIANPPGCFGWSCYGYTTFNSFPKPISDFQVRPDGSKRSIAKTHALTLEHIQWLLDSKPEVLIIALGWDGVTKPDEAIQQHKGCEVRLLRNKEAVEHYNRLKGEGRRVAIHYHSTC
jgi:hypothetical protein